MANSSHRRTSVSFTLLIVLICILGPAGGQNLSAANAGSPGGNVGAIVRIAPTESVFVLEIDSFEYTLSTVDQFLQGISPMPMGLRMLVRAQLGQILGNPALPGLDMNGTFGVFVLAPPQPVAPGDLQQLDPDKLGLAGLLVPVTDYDQFISSNPNCGAPDAQDVSRIKAGNIAVMVKQAGDFAFVTPDVLPDKAIAVADRIATAAAASGQGGADIFAPEVAAKPVRLFIDARQWLAQAGPAIEQIKQMQGAGQQGQTLPPMMMNMDFSELAKSVELESMTVGLSPSADMLNASVNAVALPNSKLAATFTRGSQGLAGPLMMLQAQPPSQMGADLTPVLALLPGADKADYVGNFAAIMQVAAMMSPVQLPAIDMKPTSSGAFAIKADQGVLTVDLAVPKQLISEVATGLSAMNPAMAQSQQLPQPQQLPTPQMTVPTAPEPVAEITPGESGSADGQLSVRVAGARLVRYSDVQRGILPLGQTDGYTLSLLAELPEPALKISGGVIERAATSTGKSLLPKHSWQRNIRYSKLSADGRAALFNLDLALPEYDVRSLAELSGQLEYVTGSGGKDIDLGMVPLKAGAKGAALNAVVVSVNEDPYGNNATMVRLKLDVAPESLKSVSFSAAGGAPIVASSAGHITAGDATTFRLAISDKAPSKASIVVTVYGQLNRKTAPFRLTNISLTGEPAG